MADQGTVVKYRNLGAARQMNRTPSQRI